MAKFLQGSWPRSGLKNIQQSSFERRFNNLLNLFSNLVNSLYSLADRKGTLMGQDVLVLVMHGANLILLPQRFVQLLDKHQSPCSTLLPLTWLDHLCQTAMSASGDLDEASANETTGILNDINGTRRRKNKYVTVSYITISWKGRSSLEDDLTSCATDRQGVTVNYFVFLISCTWYYYKYFFDCPRSQWPLWRFESHSSGVSGGKLQSLR